MRTYTNKEVQKAVEGIQQTIIGFDKVIADMRYTTEFLGRRESDKTRKELTQSQRETLAANAGKHIYGSSHPLYKGE